ncbi:MAG: LacI family DNA-binding transcriptional regulator [Puniceicoccales bacterium]
MDEETPSVGVTMADVARLAGVHPSTVSRALRGDTRISAEVREQVREVADRLGYRPNPLLTALSSLRHQHSQHKTPTTLAYVLREETHVTDHFKGVKKAATASGFKVEVFTIGSSLSPKRLNQILTYRNILGVILAPLPEAHGSFELDWDKYATVALEYTFLHPRFDRIVPDSFQSVVQVLKQCANYGHRRVGIVLSHAVHERNEGLLVAAYEYHMRRDNRLVLIEPLIVGPEGEEAAIHDWLLRAQPEVVITSNRIMSEVRKCMDTLGLDVPRQIGLVNLNADPVSPEHAGIVLNAQMMGEQAAYHLVHKLHHNQFGVPASPVSIQTYFRWVDGPTLIPAKEMERPAVYDAQQSAPVSAE